MTGEFSWDIRRLLGLSFSLGRGVTEAFGAVPLTGELLADQPMWRVPFYVIADMMEGAIDHAWWLLAADRSAEPWGFVTEPYIEEEKAQRLARQLRPGLSIGVSRSGLCRRRNRLGCRGALYRS